MKSLVFNISTQIFHKDISTIKIFDKTAKVNFQIRTSFSQPTRRSAIQRIKFEDEITLFVFKKRNKI